MSEAIKEIIKQRKYELIGILLIVIAILNGIGFTFGEVGVVGDLLSFAIQYIVGYGSYAVTALIFSFGIMMIYKSKFNIKMRLRLIGLFLFLINYLVFLHIQSGVVHTEEFDIVGEKIGGGLIGGFLLYLLRVAFGELGSYVILGAVSLFAILLVSDILLVNLFLHLRNLKDSFTEFATANNIFASKKSNQKDSSSTLKKPEQTEKKESFFLVSKLKALFNKLKNNDSKVKKEEQKNQINKQKSKKTVKENKEEKKKPKKRKSNQVFQEKKKTEEEKKTKVSRTYNSSDNLQQKLELDGYQLPTLDLLDIVEQSENVFLDQTDILKETLDNFGVQAEVVDVNYGPTVTRYEVQPAPGVKVSKILSLSDDIALSMAASDVRIEAPIPGKAAVGIEMPNQNQSLVSIRELLDSDTFQNSGSKLTIALGKDIAGNAKVADLAKMPHMLVAGATGSGKSVFINSVINSILYKADPEEVKFLLIDPKMVELTIYKGIPHLVAPVVTDAKKASTALRWVVQQMERRYELFAAQGARGIDTYNRQIDDKEDKLPYVVVIIDELADLMMVSANEVEDAICRLAQKARAAGIHLILATQRPSVDVITGVIKANIPTRVSFSLSSQADSRTILDEGGAEKLLGKGDMLFSPVDSNKPKRIQGAFISDKELKRVVNFVKQQEKPDYDEKIADIKDKNVEIELDDEQDELYEKAVKLVVEHRASISMLQRRLRVGYNRAARMIDMMEEDDIVGPHRGSKAREVLIEEEDLEEILSSS